MALILVGLSLVCAGMAWRAHRVNTQAINSLGRQYGIERWKGESNDAYWGRICNRAIISGGKRPW